MHRRTGTIARLPKNTRDRINEMLRDGAPYNTICDTFAAENISITPDHLTRWVSGGYNDWTKEQLWIEARQRRLDFATDLLTQDAATTLHHAGIQVAATQLVENLLDAGPELLKDDPASYIRLVNAVSRLSHEALNYQKHREACERAREQLNQLRNPKSPLTEEERNAILSQVDHLLGLK